MPVGLHHLHYFDLREVGARRGQPWHNGIAKIILGGEQQYPALRCATLTAGPQPPGRYHRDDKSEDLTFALVG